MALEVRNGRPYYYRHKRKNGKVIREYVASGPLALQAAELDAREREQRRAKRAADEDKRMQYEAARIPLLDLIDRTATLADALLIDAGYHRQNRGRWRRRRT